MPEPPIIAFATAVEFRQWLTRHHADHRGIWMKIARKTIGIPHGDLRGSAGWTRCISRPTTTTTSTATSGA